MKKWLFLFAVVVLFGLKSCYRQVTCPEFNEEILDWIPYQENDRIELYSQLKDSTITISIKSVEVTHTTDYKTGYDCGGCDDEILIRQNDSDHFKFQVDIRLNRNTIAYQYQIGDTYYFEGNYIYSEKKNYLLEDIEYDMVRIFEKNDSKGRYNRLIIAKDFGIIGLIDVFGNTWVLKNNVKIRRLNGRDRGNIVINNVSGC